MERYVKPLISVIVPAYNDAPFLHRCLDSILNQTYDALEILLIDDGSTDGSGAVCDEYALIDKRVRAVHKTNEGTVSARACGLKYAHGELVSFIDGDDWIDNNMYERLVAEYHRYGCPDIVSSGITYEYLNGKNRVRMDGIHSGRHERTDIVNKLLPVLVYDTSNNCPTVLTSVCTKLIRKENAQKAMEYMDYDLTLGEDGAYVYFLIACCDAIAVVNESFYHYEQHECSQNFSYDFGAFQKMILLRQILVDGMDRLGYGKNIQIQSQINYYIWCYLHKILNEQFYMKFSLCTYLFPFAKCDRGCEVLLYGAGAVGRAYERCLRQSGYANRIIWADRNYKELQNMGVNVMSVENALEQHYDYVVIAIEDKAIAKNIMEELIDRGVESRKLVWERPTQIFPYNG